MGDISERQHVFLERVKDEVAAGRLALAARRLYDALRAQDDKSLDPSWVDLWRKIKPAIRGELPGSIIERIDASISKIPIDDEAVWELRLSEEQRVTVLLGAGASAPAPSNIPVVSKLLPELWRRAKKIGREDLDSLASWCNSRQISNIEDLLTAAYVANFAAKNNSVTALLDYFLFSRRRASQESLWEPTSPDVDSSSITLIQDTLQTLFGLLASTMILAEPNNAHSALATFLRQHNGTKIVTTNYDGCMDEALLKAGHSLEGIIGASSNPDNEDIDLIKMHGSINWAYCDSCQTVRDFSLLDLKDAFERDRFSYSVVGICRTCEGQRRPLLVPPLSFKFMTFPNLLTLWSKARQAIESAAIIIAIGYSFSEADTYITKMIFRSLSVNSKQKLILCDTDGKLKRRLVGQLSARIESFDPLRVLQLTQSCEASLPTLLVSLTSKDAKESPTRPDLALQADGTVSV